MKKLLTISTIALFALVGLGATKTTHADTDTDIWAHYIHDDKAMKGTFVRITCHFGNTVNDYGWWSDDDDAFAEKLFGIGKYRVVLPHTTLKHNHRYGFVMQKTEGGNQPNFVIETDPDAFAEYEWVNLDDLKDNDIHYASFHFNKVVEANSPTYVEGDFGSHTSGTEQLKGYFQDLEA